MVELQKKAKVLDNFINSNHDTFVVFSLSLELYK